MYRLKQKNNFLIIILTLKKINMLEFSCILFDGMMVFTFKLIELLRQIFSARHSQTLIELR